MQTVASRFLKKFVLHAAAAILLLALPATALAYKDPPFELPPPAELKKIRSAVINTEKGDIWLELYPEDAPWHVANFKYLADRKYYDNLAFHLFYPGYIIQGGAPTKDPNSGPGYSLPPEFNSHKHVSGVLGMARALDLLNPERRSNGSQFYLVLGDAPNMDGSYTVFGAVTSGMEVLQNLEKGDRIKRLVVYVRPPVAR